MSGAITMFGSCPVSAGLDDGSGGPGTHGGPEPGAGDRTSDNARPLAEVGHPRKLRRSQSSASRATENHPMTARVNPDASLYCSAPGNDALARHGRAALGGWSGSAVRRRLACGAALAARSCRRSRLGRGRNSCRSLSGRDSPRKETVEPAARHGVRTRKRQVDGRHDCQDNAPACVPSTVWGTASRQNSQVGLGAVLALENEQALSRHPPRVSPSQPQRARPPANGTHSSTKSSRKPPLRQPRSVGRCPSLKASSRRLNADSRHRRQPCPHGCFTLCPALCTARHATVTLLFPSQSVGGRSAGTHEDHSMLPTINPGALVVQPAYPDPLFELMRDGAATGFDIELMHAVCTRLGLKLQPVAFQGDDFNDIFKGLLEGTCDAVISGTTITPQRAAIVRFSRPYLTFNQGIAVNRSFAELR